MNPRISVIVPVYNTEKYLRRCVDSILAQTFTDFELLLIDDGSKDSSGAICDEYAKADQRVRVFHKPNGGASSARNLGLDNVTAAPNWGYCASQGLRYYGYKLHAVCGIRGVIQSSDMTAASVHDLRFFNDVRWKHHDA